MKLIPGIKHPGIKLWELNMGLNPRLISIYDKKDLLCGIFKKNRDKLDKNCPISDPVRIQSILVLFVTLMDYEYL
jgi:hypothetical protein